MQEVKRGGLVAGSQVQRKLLGFPVMFSLSFDLP